MDLPYAETGQLVYQATHYGRNMPSAIMMLATVMSKII